MKTTLSRNWNSELRSTNLKEMDRRIVFYKTQISLHLLRKYRIPRTLQFTIIVVVCLVLQVAQTFGIKPPKYNKEQKCFISAHKLFKKLNIPISLC